MKKKPITGKEAMTEFNFFMRWLNEKKLTKQFFADSKKKIALEDKKDEEFIKHLHILNKLFLLMKEGENSTSFITLLPGKVNSSSWEKYQEEYVKDYEADFLDV